MSSGHCRLAVTDGIAERTPNVRASPPFGDPDKMLTPAVRRLVGKFDPAERDARNRDLGKAGEKFVVEFERDRLRRAGRNDLAEDVGWVADLDGDGYGYDVRSFET